MKTRVAAKVVSITASRDSRVRRVGLSYEGYYIDGRSYEGTLDVPVMRGAVLWGAQVGDGVFVEIGEPIRDPSHAEDHPK